MAYANNWSENVAYQHFALPLRGSAEMCLRFFLQINDHTKASKPWTAFKSLFKKQLTTQMEDNSSFIDSPPSS